MEIAPMGIAPPPPLPPSSPALKWTRNLHAVTCRPRRVALLICLRGCSACHQRCIASPETQRGCVIHVGATCAGSELPAPDPVVSVDHPDEEAQQSPCTSEPVREAGKTGVNRLKGKIRNLLDWSRPARRSLPGSRGGEASTATAGEVVDAAAIISTAGALQTDQAPTGVAAAAGPAAAAPPEDLATVASRMEMLGMHREDAAAAAARMEMLGTQGGGPRLFRAMSDVTGAASRETASMALGFGVSEQVAADASAAGCGVDRPDKEAGLACTEEMPVALTTAEWQAALPHGIQVPVAAAMHGSLQDGGDSKAGAGPDGAAQASSSKAAGQRQAVSVRFDSRSDGPALAADAGWSCATPGAHVILSALPCMALSSVPPAQAVCCLLVLGAQAVSMGKLYVRGLNTDRWLQPDQFRWGS